MIADLLQDCGEPETPDGHPMPLFLNALLAATAGDVGRPYREELQALGAPRGRRLMPGETLRATAGPASGLKLRIDAELTGAGGAGARTPGGGRASPADTPRFAGTTTVRS